MGGVRGLGDGGGSLRLRLGVCDLGAGEGEEEEEEGADVFARHGDEVGSEVFGEVAEDWEPVDDG